MLAGTGGGGGVWLPIALALKGLVFTIVSEDSLLLSFFFFFNSVLVVISDFSL